MTTRDRVAESRDRVAERRKVAWEVVGEQLVHAHGLGQTLELVLAEIAVRRRGRSASSVASEKTICPPWPAFAMRAARTTSTPV